MSLKLNAIEMLISMFGNVKDEIHKENKNYSSLFKKISTYPIKLVATFIFAPFILFKMITHSNIPFFRKFIAIIGLILAALGVYLLTTYSIIWLGFMISTYLGWLSAIGYAASVIFTTWVSVLIQIFIFNAIATLMLKISQQDIINYLNTLADGTA